MSTSSGRERIAMGRRLARTRYERRLYRRFALALLAEITLAPLAGGWALMAIVGKLHAGWWHAVPPMRFATAWAVVFLLLAAIEIIVYGSKLLKGWVGDA